MQGLTLEPSPPDGLESHDNLLQSGYWADVKQRQGNRILSFVITSDAGPIESALSGRLLDRLPLLVLVRKLPGPGACSFAYIPPGPDMAVADEDRLPFLEWVSSGLAPHLPQGCLFFRFDLPWKVDGAGGRDTALAPPFKRAPVDVQVPDTVVIDLLAGEDEILARMKPKTRYNIGLAGRKGVVVREGGRGDLGLWYEMALETAGRDMITLHAKSYFDLLFEEAENHPETRVVLFIAEVKGEAVAAVVITIHGRRAIYHFGASRTEGRNLMPTFALQWEAIRYAKAAGCAAYDLLGIPPSDDPKHPLHGLFRLKTGFGGDIVHRAGCWDFPLRPFVYRAFRSAERARNFYFKAVRRKLLGFTISRSG